MDDRMFEKRLEKIRRKQIKIAVVGLGYVGLPLACLFARAGFQVLGVERDAEKVSQVNQGYCPIQGEEPGLAELLADVVGSQHLRASGDYAGCRDVAAVFVVVETPVDRVTNRPEYAALRAALGSLGPCLSKGTLVVIESTIAPGTMERVVRPVLEEFSGLQAGQDFFLAHCPERVMPGKLLYNLQHMHRVVGGMTYRATALTIELYRHIVQGDLDSTDALTAEIVKTAENTYRDVQIAFANEMALLCETLGADVWQVRELVNKSPYRNMHLPGAGVGGHCLPKDPWLLIAHAPAAFEARLIPAARAVNEGMPLHVIELLADGLQSVGKEVRGARVAVLGYAYLENSDDIRNSPSAVLVARLAQLGVEVLVHDPYVAGYQRELREIVRGCDAIVFMVGHDVYRKLDLEALGKQLSAHPVLVDGRHLFSAEQALGAGWEYRGIGYGK